MAAASSHGKRCSPAAASDSDFSASEEETSDEDEQAAEEAREERRKPLLSEIVMPSWENVVYDRAEWAAMLGRIDIQAQ